jgi:hypothetical protein
VRKKPAKTTKERGLGWEHQKRVAQLKQRHRPGTPCRLCGKPMWDVSTLDGGHARGQERALGGKHLPDALEHRGCNRSAGAKFLHAMQGHRPPPTEKPRVETYRAPGW